VIENSRTPGYFTEKLIDSCLSSSVPIYWGAPDIEHFFDPSGMVVCRNERELRDAVLRVGDGEYERRREGLSTNRERAMWYCDPHQRAARLLHNEDRILSDA
jgi:hypothetical protein